MGFEVQMAKALDLTNMLLFYVDSKLYRGYSDMVDRAKLEYEKRAMSEQQFHMVSKESMFSMRNRKPGDAPSGGAGVGKMPDLVPQFEQEPLFQLTDDSLFPPE